jgi:23S rRNA (adenine2503-C2)-methyltransferase
MDGMENVNRHSRGTGSARRALLDLEPHELRAWFEEHGEPPMRGRQVQRWLLGGRAEAFEEMTDLPRIVRESLAAEFMLLGTRIVRHLKANDGTHKLLLALDDQELIECVLLQEADRRTACISTQVGCGMGCVFCASGLGGVARNLTRGEILEQLLHLRNLLPDQERLTHIVVMGMGEPLANLDNLVAALEIAGAKDGLGIGARHITISSVGLPVKIRRLADLGKQYHLAVSLHAPSDRLRTQIVPTNTKTGLAAILEAADYFFERTGRQVTFEYVLLRGLNDHREQARELANLLRRRHAHVNLIPFNDVEGLPYRRPTDEALSAFVAELRQAGVSVKVRKRKGSEIDAACGQLRRTETGIRGQESGIRSQGSGRESKEHYVRTPDS